MKQGFIGLVGLLMSIFLAAQQPEQTIFESLASQQADEGVVVLHQSTDLKAEVEGHTEYMRKFIGCRGYRIQIRFFSGNKGRKKAYKLKSELLEKLPQYMPYVIYNQPYFKVRLGDFFTKSEALKALETVKTAYPDAFIVEDLIDYLKATNPQEN